MDPSKISFNLSGLLSATCHFMSKKNGKRFGGIGKNTLSLHPLSERGQRSEGDEKQGPGIENAVLQGEGFQP